MAIDIQARLRREFNDNEQLLWAGVPAQGMRFHTADLLMVPFSLLWGGFAFLWEGGVLYSSGVRLTATAPFVTGSPFSFMAIWGIPFCLVGLYITVGRFFFDAVMRARTVYGVTDRRILIARGSSIKSLALSALPEIELKARGSGRGTIVFGQSSFFAVSGWPAWGYRRYGQPMMFDGIGKAREVYALIVDAAHKLGSR